MFISTYIVIVKNLLSLYISLENRLSDASGCVSFKDASTLVKVSQFDKPVATLCSLCVQRGCA